MNVTFQGTEFNMTGVKPMYGVVLAATMASVGTTFDGMIQRITFVVALLTAVLFLALTYHNWRIARRKDIRQKQDYEKDQQVN